MILTGFYRRVGAVRLAGFTLFAKAVAEHECLGP